MRLTRSGRSRAIKAAYPAASLLTEKPTPSGRTCTSKRPFETSIPTKTSCNAIILSPSCDCGREPRQLFGREMKGSAGALLDTGENPTIAYGRGAAAARTWPRPALRRALWTIARRQDCFVAFAPRNDARNGEPSTRSLERPPCLQRGGERAVVEVVELAADRHTLGEPRELDPAAGEALGEIMRGGLTLDRGVERQDELLAGPEAPDQAL